jgi:hypothetical protein
VGLAGAAGMKVKPNEAGSPVVSGGAGVWCVVPATVLSRWCAACAGCGLERAALLRRAPARQRPLHLPGVQRSRHDEPGPVLQPARSAAGAAGVALLEHAVLHGLQRAVRLVLTAPGAVSMCRLSLLRAWQQWSWLGRRILHQQQQADNVSPIDAPALVTEGGCVSSSLRDFLPTGS